MNTRIINGYFYCPGHSPINSKYVEHIEVKDLTLQIRFNFKGGNQIVWSFENKKDLNNAINQLFQDPIETKFDWIEKHIPELFKMIFEEVEKFYTLPPPPYNPKTEA